MPFRTCPVCGLTYNYAIMKHTHDATQTATKKEEEKKPDAESKSTGFKAYLERFGVKQLK